MEVPVLPGGGGSSLGGSEVLDKSTGLEFSFHGGFNASYQRNNKKGGKKHLRCFPCCGPNHKVSNACEVAVKVRFSSGDIDPANDEKMYLAMARFLPLMEDGKTVADAEMTDALGDLSLGDELNTEKLCRFERTPDAPFEPLYSAKVVEFHERSVLFEFREKAWHYSWKGGRYKQNTEHVLRIYIFEGKSSIIKNGRLHHSPTEMVRCIGKLSSPTFTVYSSRSAPGKGTKKKPITTDGVGGGKAGQGPTDQPHLQPEHPVKQEGSSSDSLQMGGPDAGGGTFGFGFADLSSQRIEINHLQHDNVFDGPHGQLNAGFLNPQHQHQHQHQHLHQTQQAPVPLNNFSLGQAPQQNGREVGPGTKRRRTQQQSGLSSFVAYGQTHSQQQQHQHQHQHHTAQVHSPVDSVSSPGSETDTQDLGSHASTHGTPDDEPISSSTSTSAAQEQFFPLQATAGGEVEHRQPDEDDILREISLLYGDNAQTGDLPASTATSTTTSSPPPTWPSSVSNPGNVHENLPCVGPSTLPPRPLKRNLEQDIAVGRLGLTAEQGGGSNRSLQSLVSLASEDLNLLLPASLRNATTAQQQQQQQQQHHQGTQQQDVQQMLHQQQQHLQQQQQHHQYQAQAALRFTAGEMNDPLFMPSCGGTDSSELAIFDMPSNLDSVHATDPNQHLHRHYNTVTANFEGPSTAGRAAVAQAADGTGANNLRAKLYEMERKSNSDLSSSTKDSTDQDDDDDEDDMDDTDHEVDDRGSGAGAGAGAGASSATLLEVKRVELEQEQRAQRIPVPSAPGAPGAKADADEGARDEGRGLLNATQPLPQVVVHEAREESHDSLHPIAQPVEHDDDHDHDEARQDFETLRRLKEMIMRVARNNPAAIVAVVALLLAVCISIGRAIVMPPAPPPPLPKQCHQFAVGPGNNAFVPGQPSDGGRLLPDGPFGPPGVGFPGGGPPGGRFPGPRHRVLAGRGLGPGTGPGAGPDAGRAGGAGGPNDIVTRCRNQISRRNQVLMDINQALRLRAQLRSAAVAFVTIFGLSALYATRRHYQIREGRRHGRRRDIPDALAVELIDTSRGSSTADAARAPHTVSLDTV